MSLAPLQMSVLASDGLILKGTLTYPAGANGRNYPLAVLAHQYPATRDSFAPLIADLLALGVATLAFDERGHGDSTTSPRGPVVVDTPEGVTLEAFGAAFVSSVAKVGFHRIENDVVRVTAGALAFGPDGPERIRAAVERAAGIGFLLTSSQSDPFEGAASAEAWSRGLGHPASRLVPGGGHAMAIYFAVRDAVVAFLRDALDVH